MDQPRLQYDIRGHLPHVTFSVGAHVFHLSCEQAEKIAIQIEDAPPADVRGDPHVLVHIEGATLIVPKREAEKMPNYLRSAIRYAQGGEP